MSYPSGIGVYSPKIRDSSVVRRFLSRGGTGYLSLMVFNGSEPVDPEANTISLKVWWHSGADIGGEEDPRGTIIASVDDHTGSNTIKKEDTGLFYYTLGPELTQNRGVLTAEWSYTSNGHNFKYTDYLKILDQMPTFDRLSDQSKYAIESVTWQFADGFDSTEGGLWLQENFQTHWDYEKLAYLLDFAAGKLNNMGQPPTQFGIFAGQKKFPKDWTFLLTWALKLEVLRHLIRSYTEQPEWRNMDVTYSDRRDYSTRWKEILEEEKPEFKEAVINTKRSLLSLARGSLIVSGGYYTSGSGGFGGMFNLVAAQRAFRFYPSAPAVQFPTQGIYR